MPRLSSIAACVVLNGLAASAPVVLAETPGDGDLVFFEKEVRPLLVKHCYECHSEEAGKRKGGLWLDRRGAWQEGGDAGPGNQGAFTRYRYCTVGTDPSCTSTIQMVGPGICQHWIVGQPQQGQTPEGRLSNVAQTVYWQVDPGTYTGATFDITVTWTVDLATSTSNLWWNKFRNLVGDPQSGPEGYCNSWGCSCGITTTTAPITLSQTFKVPLPSSSQCPS